MKIPTLYNSIQEFYLDTAIYGKIVSSRARSKEELKGVLFEEFKLSHPLPTLELQRYELSEKVSDDFEVGDEELELQENEELIDLTQDNIVLDIPDSFDDVPNDVKVLYNYENRVTDELREKYLNFGIEEYTGNSSVFGTVEANTDTILTDEEIEKLETGNFKEEVVSNEEGGYEYEYEEEESDEVEDYEYEEEEESDEIEEYEYEEEEESEEVGEYEEESDDEEGYEYEEEEDSDEIEEYEYEEDESNEEEYEYEYEEEESDEVEDYEDEEYEYEDDSDTGGNTYEEVQEDVLSEEKRVSQSTKQPNEEVIDDIDTSSCFVEETFSERASPTKKEEVIDKEPSLDEVPRDLRQFLRKYPRCDIKFALKYFSKKEIDKAILIGKVVRRGNKLHI